MGAEPAINKKLLAAIVRKACENQLDGIIPGLQSALRTVGDVEVLERQFEVAATNLQKNAKNVPEELQDSAADIGLKCIVFSQMLRELRRGNDRYVQEALGI